MMVVVVVVVVVVVDKAIFKGAKYGFASHMLVREDFDVPWQNIKGSREESEDVIAVYHTTSELTRTGFCVALALIYTYQQSEDGTIGRAVGEIRKRIKADEIVSETYVGTWRREHEQEATYRWRGRSRSETNLP